MPFGRVPFGFFQVFSAEYLAKKKKKPRSWRAPPPTQGFSSSLRGPAPWESPKRFPKECPRAPCPGPELSCRCGTWKVRWAKSPIANRQRSTNAVQLSQAILGACAMTTKYLDNKISLSKFCCRGVSHENKHFGRIFLSAPKALPPPQKRIFYFHCRLAVSDIPQFHVERMLNE